MRRERSRHRIDWQRACEAAARDRQRRQDRVVIVIVTVIAVLGMIIYYIVTDPV